MVRNIFTRYGLILLLSSLSLFSNTNCADLIVGGPHIIASEDAERKFNDLLLFKLSLSSRPEPEVESEGESETEGDSKKELSKHDALLLAWIDYDSADSSYLLNFCRRRVYYLEKDVNACLEHLSAGIRSTDPSVVLEEYVYIRGNRCNLKSTPLFNSHHPLEGEIKICDK